MSVVKNVMSQLGKRVQDTAGAVSQVVGGSVATAVSSRLGTGLSKALPAPHSSGEPKWDARAMEKQVRALGEQHFRYHPFMEALIQGQLEAEQVRRWVRNWLYYLASFPRKEAWLLANCPDRGLRKQWIGLLMDFDGSESYPGILERWSALSEMAGLPADEVWTFDEIEPAVKLSVDALAELQRTLPWQKAASLHLLGVFSSEWWKAVIKAFQTHYKWISPKAQDIFKELAAIEKRHAQLGIYVSTEALADRADQQDVLDAIAHGLNLCWLMVDAIDKPFKKPT